jgi:hypothetical protein
VYPDRSVYINGELTTVTGFGDTVVEPKRKHLGILIRKYLVDNMPWPLVCFFEDENLEHNEYCCKYLGWGIAKNKNVRGSFICYYPKLEEPPVIDSMGEYW